MLVTLVILIVKLNITTVDSLNVIKLLLKVKITFQLREMVLEISD